MIKFNNDVEAVQYLNEKFQAIKAEIGNIIIGHELIIDQLLIALLCKGHCLLIGVPGLAKTLLIKTLSQCLNLSYNRIQFTPDLMPGDITGIDILEQDAASGNKKFRFVKGPIFSNVILADEINRTPPKTQSALLEAMQEHQITVSGEKYILDEPFFVLATQNPIEQEGTYPLPEAQLDRFMFNLWLDYPSPMEEIQIVKTTTSQYEGKVSQILDKQEILFFQELVRRVPIAENVIEYSVNLAQKTRPKFSNDKFIVDNISWGAGPRASQFMVLAAKAKAVLRGDYSPSIDDIKDIALPVLRHRIIPTFSAEADGISSADIVNYLLK